MTVTDDTIDWEKVADCTLALLHLTTFEEQGVARAWKSHEWEVMNRLHDAGWIQDPATKAKSVVMTEAGRKRSRELFERLFRRAV